MTKIHRNIIKNEKKKEEKRREFIIIQQQLNKHISRCLIYMNIEIFLFSSYENSKKSTIFY